MKPRHQWDSGSECKKCGLHRDTRKEAPNFTWGGWKPSYYYWAIREGKQIIWKKLPPCKQDSARIDAIAPGQ